MGVISKADRHAFTVAYMAGPRPAVVVGPFCSCSERPYPHDAHVDEMQVFEGHRSLRYAMQRPDTARPKRAAGNVLPKKARAHR
jgi:hypothetical protein